MKWSVIDSAMKRIFFNFQYNGVFVITRAKPPYGIFWSVLNFSLRANGTQLGLCHTFWLLTVASQLTIQGTA